MTRISGCLLLACPHCQAVYRKPNYVSMNFMAMYVWTDGYREASLMPPGEYMRLCTQCDQIYDIREAPEVGSLTKEEMYEPPPPLPPPEPEPTSAWGRFRRWMSRTARRRPTRTLFPDLRADLPPHAEWVPTEQAQQRLEALLAEPHGSNPNAREFETELRMRLWQSGNDWFRPLLAKAREEQATVPPPWTQTDAQLENLRGLKALFLAPGRSQHDTMLLVEVHRQLGEFDEAEALLETFAQDHEEAEYQRLLVGKRMRHVGRYPN